LPGRVRASSGHDALEFDPFPVLTFWPHCGRAADPGTGSTGCPGILLPGRPTCLAHPDEADRAAHLAALSPGDDIDLRGTPFTQDLLDELFRALTDPATGRPRFGTLLLEGAHFDGGLRCDGAEFGGDLSFEGAHIDGDVSFGKTRVGGEISFHEARIGGSVQFFRVRIGDDAVFDRARIDRSTSFTDVRIDGRARFAGTVIGGGARFTGMVFERTTWLGPLVCAGVLDLSEAVFGAAVTTWVGRFASGSPARPWSSTGHQLLLPPSHSLLSALGRSSTGCPYEEQFTGVGSVGCQEAEPPAFQPGATERATW
jgi:cytoskeletal protein CcmA (bactofilin family)